MRFALPMALRELRSAWKRLLFFFFCIALGVAAIISLRSVTQNVKTAVNGKTRLLLTADVQATSPRPWGPQSRATIERELTAAKAAGRAAQCNVVEMSTMALHEDARPARSLRVEVKAIDARFPLYGEIRLADGVPYQFDLLRDGGALVQPSILNQLDIAIGGKLKIGAGYFTVRGVIEEEPGVGLGAFSQGPRVFISTDDVDKTQLVAFGARLRHRILIKMPEESIAPFLAAFKRDFKERNVSAVSYRNSQEQLGAQIDQAEDFFGLIGLVVVALGGIGIYSVTRVFIHQKLTTIAVLKSVGATSAAIFTVYFIQIFLLGFLGGLTGLGIAAVGMRFVRTYFSDLAVPLDIQFGLTPSATVQGVAVGLFISLLFSAVPLLGVRSVKPGRLLRHESQPTTGFDVLRAAAAALACVGTLTVFAWQAGSLKIGGYFLLGLVVTAGLLWLMSAVVIRVVGLVKNLPSFTLRQGVNGLRRPNNQTTVVLVTVGLGAFFITSVRSLELNIAREIDLTPLRQTADMFVINIQTDQAPDVEAIITDFTRVKPTLIPTISTRIIGVNGALIDFDKIADPIERGRIGREYFSTYRLTPDSQSEKVVRGAFWAPAPSADLEVSLEESLRTPLGVDIGDMVTFSIQGRQFVARVTSFRKVDWRSARTGFMLVFRPGAGVDRAPQTLISGLKFDATEDDRNRLQTALVSRYPNISVIQVKPVLDRIRLIVSGVSTAIAFVGGFIFLCGIVILTGSVAMTKYQRMYESAILKTLGATQRTILGVMAIEYGILGLAAGVVASLAAVGLSWCLATQAIKIEWRWFPVVNLVSVALTAGLVVAVGCLSSLDVLLKKPLGVLRTEASN
jgi:putative ABC transport system permease protein